MKNNYVIKNVPSKVPVLGTVVYSFLMYYFVAPAWLWYVFITIFATSWLFSIINILAETKIDLIEEDDKEEKEAIRDSFKTILEKLQSQQQKKHKKK